MNVSDHRLNRTDWLYAAAIFVIALAVRLLFLLSSADRGWPHSMMYEGDAPEWVRYAAALDGNQPYEFGLPLRSPAVAYVIHWMAPALAVETVVHSRVVSFASLKALWCAASALSCSLAYLGFAQVFDRRTSLIAASLCVFSFGSYVTATSLNNEAIYTLTMTAIILATLHLVRQPTWWIAGTLALLHGLATLIRPEHTLCLGMLLIYTMWMWSRSPIAELVQSKRQYPKSKIVLLAIIFIGSILICLPWSIRGSLATQRLNNAAVRLPDYERASPPWTSDGRAFIDSLPAFTRYDNFNFIRFICRQAGDAQVTDERARQMLIEEFGCIPDDLSPWVFVSSQGPLSFALANHPEARGGFSKKPLMHPRFGPDPKLNLTMPSHLRLYNHGYAVGWECIRSDLSGWLKNIAYKLSNFSDGVTLGFTSYNFPAGRELVRRRIDLVVSPPGHGPLWRIFVSILLLAGIVYAIFNGRGGIWVVIILYKLTITILFYGYARQAVSILPAFFIFMAVPIAAFVKLLTSFRSWSRRIEPAAWGILATALFGMDVYNAKRPQRIVPTTPVHPAPQWGAEAFESFEPVRFTGRRSREISVE